MRKVFFEKFIEITIDMNLLQSLLNPKSILKGPPPGPLEHRPSLTSHYFSYVYILLTHPPLFFDIDYIGYLWKFKLLQTYVGFAF